VTKYHFCLEVPTCLPCVYDITTGSNRFCFDTIVPTSASIVETNPKGLFTNFDLPRRSQNSAIGF
jgi:hypothetical protein